MTSIIECEVVLDTAGVYDIPAGEYHADPVQGGSLSSTGARKLLPPSCPALFRYEKDNPPAHKREFDFGHAAHLLVLGAGPEIVEVKATDWRTNAAKAARAEAYEAGAVPLLPHEVDQVRAMAAALRSHPLAVALLNPDGGLPERTLVWQDADTGVWCRAMVDWLPHPSGRRRLLVDYKSAVSADTDHLARAVANFGYAQQAAWYLDGAAALDLGDAAFVFIAQAKTPPYLVTVFELDPEYLAIGAARNRRAREIYRDCTEAGIWPGYSDDVETIAPPRWLARQYEESFL